jgi:hypothetical protein
MDTAELLAVKTALPARLEQALPHLARHQDLVGVIRRLIDPDAGARFANAEEAEAGPDGLRVVDQRLADEEGPVDYERELADYLAKLVDPVINRIELPDR